jgi:hypothetical protein
MRCSRFAFETLSGTSTRYALLKFGQTSGAPIFHPNSVRPMQNSPYLNTELYGFHDVDEACERLSKVACYYIRRRTLNDVLNQTTSVSHCSGDTQGLPQPSFLPCNASHHTSNSNWLASELSLFSPTVYYRPDSDEMVAVHDLDIRCVKIPPMAHVTTAGALSTPSGCSQVQSLFCKPISFVNALISALKLGL